ncbi:heat shock 70 kDa protein 12A-like [Acipenser oxyrinchus oxyrinchus]|uniref:Heat shock 70 kDa protein 12A-like n=1 Tax=Acipenser oxyrinchus oxyrinchus TaxID=40147 RepID=A0AAD8LQB6_ACIOX|nr:heat shock 70 kDa protein 12A-like [Acipenser oxyrinchus oxyrinchus]
MSDSFLVVAIDFGTAFSGYCFCVKSCTDNIRSVFWGMGHGYRSPKTPTCALFNPEKKFIKFGYDAVIKYNTMVSEQSRKWYFFENFKMELYSKKVTKDLMISAKNGKPFHALEVFTESLRFLKDHALDTIGEETDGKNFIASDVTWVLTVPAIWDSAAKQFMRLAATQAGLVEEMGSENLVLALEPEAASVWCKQLPSTGFVQEGGGENTFEQTPGLQYIAVDCGGGTVDITVHEVLEGGSLKELQKASGGGWGGSSVDKEFRSFLRDIFHPNVWDRYEKEHPGELHKMMYHFSTQKCSSTEEDLYITCYKNLAKCVEEKKEISEFFKGIEGAEWSEGCIRITHNKLQSFFEASLFKIVNEIEAILSMPELAIEYILLVGGYASSRFLRDEVRKQFSSRCRVLCPYDSQLAIAKGAILLGNDPKIIASRVSALTYGIAVGRKFDPSVHDPRKRRVNKVGDYVYCDDLFEKLVEKGQSVGCQQVAEYFYSPIDQDQNAMCFRFFSTEKLNAMYADEPGLEKIGSFTVPMPNVRLGRNRRVRLDIKFGLTEIQATATDLTSNETQAIRLNFLTE